MPLPGAAIVFATLFSASRFILPSIHYPVPPPGMADLLAFEHLDAGQSLAFQPFEESAAGCRDVGKAFRTASHVQRSDRVAAARDRDEFPGLRQFGRGFRNFNGAV